MNLSKNTLAEQIYQILRNDILTLAIPFLEKLTLKTMQERFGVSSTPIRDAFTRLTEDSLAIHYSAYCQGQADLAARKMKEHLDESLTYALEALDRI